MKKIIYVPVKTKKDNQQPSHNENELNKYFEEIAKFLADNDIISNEIRYNPSCVYFRLYYYNDIFVRIKCDVSKNYEDKNIFYLTVISENNPREFLIYYMDITEKYNKYILHRFFKDINDFCKKHTFDFHAEGSTTKEINVDKSISSDILKNSSEILTEETDRFVLESTVGASASEIGNISLEDYYNSLEYYIDCITTIFKDKENDGCLVNGVFIEIFMLDDTGSHIVSYHYNDYRKLLKRVRINEPFLYVKYLKYRIEHKMVELPDDKTDVLTIELYCSNKR